MGGTKKGRGGLARLVVGTAPVVGGGLIPLIGKPEIVWNVRRFSTRITKDKKTTKSGPETWGFLRPAGEGRPPLHPTQKYTVVSFF